MRVGPCRGVSVHSSVIRFSTVYCRAARSDHPLAELGRGSGRPGSRAGRRSPPARAWDGPPSAAPRAARCRRPRARRPRRPAGPPAASRPRGPRRPAPARWCRRGIAPGHRPRRAPRASCRCPGSPRGAGSRRGSRWRRGPGGGRLRRRWCPRAHETLFVRGP